MDAYELRREYNRNQPSGHFFDSDWLKMLGETMSSMRVLKGTVKIVDGLGVEHECYTLSTLQKIPFVGKRRAYHHFDTTTFEHVVKA